MNLLSTPTTKVIFDIVTWDRLIFQSIFYIFLDHQGCDCYQITSPHWLLLEYWLVLHPKSPVSSRRPRAYFHWERSTLCFFMSNLNPKKVFKLTHVLCNKMTSKILLFESLTVSKISSMYTGRITKPYLLCWTKTEWFEWQRWKSILEMVMLNFSNHVCGLYLSLYIAFLRRHTLFFPWAIYPGGCSIYTSSCKSLYKKVFLTSR